MAQRLMAMTIVVVASFAACAEGDTESYRFLGGEKVQLIIEPASLGEIKEQVVSDEGSVMLPTGSTVNIKGKTIAEARTPLAEQMKKDTGAKVVNVRILVLDQPPRKVNVGGEVRQPRSITLTAGVPLSLVGAIQEAGGLNEQGDPTRVNLIHTDNDGKRTSSTYDLNKLALPGTADLGPRLAAGDVVLVPRGDRYVFNGEFNKIGLVSVGDLHLEPGEKPTLSRAIAGAGGVRREADLKKLKILRLNDKGTRDVITPNDGNVQRDPILMNGDIVQLPALQQQITPAPAKSVSIIGKVRSPGVYSIPENGLKLSKLVVLAGNFTEFAKSKKVIVNRPGAGCLKEVNVDDILKNGAWENDVELQDGDVIYVKERAF